METLDSLKSGLASGRLAGATSLKLCAADLTEFPTEILALADSLTFLNLSNNCLSELPSEFAQLKKLQIAFFNNNLFETFPRVLAQCPRLSMVSFKNNRISVIEQNSGPDSAPQVLSPTLRWLILTNNRLTSLPSTIGNLTKLQKLMLAGNQLESVPSELARCTNLELIRLSANQLESVPSELFSLPRLAWLAYAGNPCHPTNSAIDQTLPTISSASLQQQDVLGEGASGIIYKGLWKPAPSELDATQPIAKPKDIALKIFKGDITSDGSPLDEMQACIAAGAHPNIVSVIGKYQQADKNGLIFNFIPSDYKNLGRPPSLDTCTRDTYPEDTHFTVAEVLQIATGIAAAALHLHSRHIMHGDLYAHNILINDAGHSILGDFGAASFYDPAVVHQSLEKIEVRAFGCLLEDLLEYCLAHGDGMESFSPEDTEALEMLRQLQNNCMQESPANRPLFSQIANTLNSSKFS